MRTLVFGVAVMLASVPVPVDRVSEPTGAIAVISQSSLDDAPVQSVEDVLRALPDVQTYRYGDDPNGSATLGRDTVPAASPDMLGVAILDPGMAGYGDLEATIASYSAEYGTAGVGLDDAADYALFIATRSGPLGTTASTPPSALWVQTDFLIGWDDMPGWQAAPQFPGDTWQGASLALTATADPGGALTFELQDLQNNFASLDFDGFYARGDTWTMAAIDVDTITGYGGANWKYAFASHVHDGSFGSCPTCASIVTAFPAVPRMSSNLLDLDPHAWVSLTPETTDLVVVETSDPLADSWCFWLWIVLGGGAVGLGAWWYWDYRAARPWWPCTVSRRAWERVRGIESPPRACEPQRTRWRAAVRRTEQWADMVKAATDFLAEQKARLRDAEARKASYDKALKGPRGGGEGQDFSSLDGQLIRHADLEGMLRRAKADVLDARDDVARATRDLASRKASLAAAEADAEDAKAAFDACVAGPS